MLGNCGDLYNAQPSEYANMKWAIFYTEALLKDDDSREIKLL